MPNVLVIDDEPQLRQMLVRLLSSEGFVVADADNGKSAMKQLEKNDFLVVLCDVKLPDANGIELTQTIKQKYPETEVIVFTAFGKIADGVQAVKNGAFDYLVKGDDNNKIIPLISKAYDKAKLQYQVKNLQKQLNSGISFDSIIGRSVLIKQVITLSQKVAPTVASVLLTGATGSGKEVFAQAIHKGSNRASKPFVALNCASFSREILESELFGHKAGAFTGAVKDKQGLIEEAHLGTLFLDEIGEMSLELQAKLLRFLETGEFLKVGDTKPHKADVRVIAATNRNIKAEIENKNFRSDLFFRIATFEITLPALNDRVDDIPALVDYFIVVFAARVKKKITAASPEFIAKLKVHNWQGNVRELRNVIERACILCDKSELDIDVLPLDFIINYSTNNDESSLKLADIEKQHICKVLQLTKGNKTKTAELMGIGLTTLYAKIKEYNIS